MTLAVILGTDMAKAKKKSVTRAKNSEPWNRSAPKGGRHTHLTPNGKAAAKRSALKAGRPYPNLVDNMRAAGAKRRKPAKKKAAKKSAK